jgi:peptidoglycan/LPS O-acetylase OafA/YrhL
MHDNNVTPLRGLAAAAVVCHHLAIYAGIDVPFLGQAGGLLGVQLFFLVSGYLIIQSARRHSLTDYAIHRVARILPCYWVAVLVVSVVIYRRSPLPYGADWGYAVLNLLALGHLSPHALLHYDVLTVSWTLTVEWCWYLLAPLLVRLAPVDDKRWWLLSTIAAIVTSSAWVALAQLGVLDFAWADAFRREADSRGLSFLRFAFITNAAPAHLGFFMLGCALSRFEQTLIRLPAVCPGLALIAFVPFYAQWNQWLGLNPSLASGLGVGALFVLALRVRPVGGRLLHLMGEISYPVYLMHVPLLLVVFQRWQVPGIAGLLTFLAMLISTGYLIHLFVERPGIAWGRRLCTTLNAKRT